MTQLHRLQVGPERDHGTYLFAEPVRRTTYVQIDPLPEPTPEELARCSARILQQVDAQMTRQLLDGWAPIPLGAGHSGLTRAQVDAVRAQTWTFFLDDVPMDDAWDPGFDPATGPVPGKQVIDADFSEIGPSRARETLPPQLPAPQEGPDGAD